MQGLVDLTKRDFTLRAVRWLAIFALLLTLVVGSILILTGKLDQDFFDEMPKYTGEKHHFARMSIGVGAILVAMSVFGYMILWFDVPKWLFVLVVLYFVMVVLNFGYGLCMFTYMNSGVFESKMRTAMEKELDKADLQAFHKMESKYRCCGIDYFRDYQYPSRFQRYEGLTVPGSCCVSSVCSHSFGDAHQYYPNGCVYVLSSKTSIKILGMGVRAIIVAIILSINAGILRAYLCGLVDESTFF